MPIIRKPTASEACGLYATREILPRLGIPIHCIESVHHHDHVVGRRRQRTAKTVHLGLSLPGGRTARVELVMLQRPDNAVYDKRWHPCIFRIRLDDKPAIVRLLRLYFDLDTENQLDLMPRIIGYRQLLKTRECRRGALINIKYSFAEHDETTPLKHRATPPPV